MKTITTFAPALLLPLSALATPHVNETIELTRGWNAVYIESTPDHALCEEFFADTPVVGAAAYVSDADAATAQYDANGKEILQAPLSYLQWVRGESVSTLQSIVGGNAFLLYATNAATIAFQGVPAAPRITWRKVSAAETNELLNLAGVSSASDSVSIQDYFGEGPFGALKTPSRAIYSLGGEDTEAGPDLRNAEKGAFGKVAPVTGGKAYALTATGSGEWPGVIGVQGDGVFFGPDANFASIRIQNRGTTTHAFRLSMERSASGETPPPLSRRLPRTDAISAPGWTNVADAAWTVALEPGEVTEQLFRIDRSRLEPGTEYGAILSIEDPDKSKMRVRLPIAVAADPEGAVAYPTGLWVGEIALTKVSGMNDETPTPVEAGGTLRMNVMVHVAEDGACTLLQRVAAGVDTNGTARLFRELSDVPPQIEGARRLSTVMMSVDTPAVAAAEGSAFGKDATFSWTVDAKARDNPFRHAWHPDHDGKTADYGGDAPSGDDFENYAQPVKPELWSIANRLDLSWHEQGDPALPVRFPYNADETTSGVVTWEVGGLSAKGPIKSTGTFSLKRVFQAKALE